MSSASKLYGLIGKPVKHSFSKDYFTKKFAALDLKHHQYQLFELAHIEEFTTLIEDHPQLLGLNVTIPYKKLVIPYMTSLSPEAEKIGAVNTIKITATGALIGYNTDYFGFLSSLQSWLNGYLPPQALILGTGGAAMAVRTALDDLGINYKLVSRQPKSEALSYEDVDALNLASFPLIINTTPLGMAPDLESAPSLNYHQLGSDHYLYDLVYNPTVTTFMEKAQARGARVKNGLEMLHLQAEKAWEIWSGE